MNKYKNLGKDMNSFPFMYRTWTTDEPDLTADYYYGPKSGELPFEDISSYVVDGYEANFSIPLFSSWKNTKTVMPSNVGKTQAIVADGYITIFGGFDNSAVSQALASNPEKFSIKSDLGFTYHSYQILKINNNIYLLGGVVDGYATSAIYMADIYTHTLTQVGDLPEEIFDSNIFNDENNIYLFGGYNVNPLDKIYKADIADITSWTNVGTLPIAIAGGVVGVVEDKLHIFGGYNTFALDSVLTADLTDLTTFVQSSIGRAFKYPKFFRCGVEDYIICNETYNSSATSFANVYRVDVNAPEKLRLIAKVPSHVDNGPMAVIYDHVYLFGGNALDVIYRTNMMYKYNPISSDAYEYGFRTITRLSYEFDVNTYFAILGINPLITTY